MRRVFPSGCRAGNWSPNLTSADGNLQVTWHAILRDGSRYLREQVVIFTAGKNRCR